MPGREYIIPSDMLQQAGHAGHVLHVTSSALIGGTERMLLRFLERCDRERFHHSVAAMQPEGPLLKAVEEMGFPAYGLPAQSPFLPSVRGTLQALMAHGRFSLVHAYGLRAEVLARGLAHKAGVRGYVSAIRSPDPWRRFYHVWLDRWTARGGRVDLFLSNSEAGRRSRVERERFAAERIRTVHNGIEIPERVSEEEAARVRAQYGIRSGEGPIVVVVSNLRYMKGHMDLIAATALVAEQHPRMRVLCAGRDDSEGEVAHFAKEAGVSDRMVFCGFVKDPLPLASIADVYCMPSHWEGCPTALLEAMALRLPIVATRVGGIPELVREGEEALLVEARNPRALAAALGDLLSDKAKAGRLAEAAYQRVRKEFSLEHMVRQIESSYEEVLAKKGH